MMLRDKSRKLNNRCTPLGALLVVALCTTILPACHPPQTPSTDAASSPAEPLTAALAKHGITPRPSPFAFHSATAAASAVSVTHFEELLQHYPLAQQRTIKAWYASHAADSMSFHTDAQWKWMQQRDYPTPDDVLRASTMTEVQLRILAMQGDTKANFFYLARLIDDYAQTDRSRPLLDQSKDRLRVEMSASMSRALASGSAFAGYMFGGYYAALHGKATADIGNAAGLAWVDSFGDSRPVFTNRQMALGFPGVSGVSVAEVYFDMFASAARLNPYFMNTYRGQGEALMPSRWQR